MEDVRKAYIDIHKRNVLPIIAVAGDTARAIEFHILASGVIYPLGGKSIRAWGETPNGASIFADLQITDAAHGIAKLKLTNNMLASGGRLKLMLSIYQGNDIVSTIPFELRVSYSLRNDEAVESQNEFTALTQALAQVEVWNKYFENTSLSIELKYTKRLNDLERGITHRLKWISASNTLTNGMYPSEAILNHLAYQGISQTLVIMVNIQDKTDSKPQMMDNLRVTTAIDNATAKGVQTVMLKPHLGIGWSDGTERYNLQPSDMIAMLANWKTILMNYAQICNEKGIPVLCIGCEQRTMTIAKYTEIWQDIVTSIKSQYPDLILTYAADSVEGIQKDESCIYVLNGLDYIGLNLYPQWYKKPTPDGLTYRDLMPCAYNAYAPTKDGFHYIERAEYIYNTYGKKVYLTEIGVMPFDDGLVVLKSKYAENSAATRNYNVPALCYEAIFNTFAKCKYIDGIALWGTKFPFCYFEETSDNGVSPAEEVIKNYIDGGDLVE